MSLEPTGKVHFHYKRAESGCGYPRRPLAMCCSCLELSTTHQDLSRTTGNLASLAERTDTANRRLACAPSPLPILQTFLECSLLKWFDVLGIPVRIHIPNECGLILGSKRQTEGELAVFAYPCQTPP